MSLKYNSILSDACNYSFFFSCKKPFTGAYFIKMSGYKLLHNTQYALTNVLRVRRCKGRIPANNCIYLFKRLYLSSVHALCSRISGVLGLLCLEYKPILVVINKSYNGVKFNGCIFFTQDTVAFRNNKRVICKFPIIYVYIQHRYLLCLLII